jgi:hypothetical protein
MDKHSKAMLEHIKYLNKNAFEKLEAHPNLNAILNFMFCDNLNLEDRDLFINMQTGWRIYDIYTTEDNSVPFEQIAESEYNFIRNEVASEFIISDFRINDLNLIFNA